MMAAYQPNFTAGLQGCFARLCGRQQNRQELSLVSLGGAENYSQLVPFTTCNLPATNAEATVLMMQALKICRYGLSPLG